MFVIDPKSNEQSCSFDMKYWISKNRIHQIFVSQEIFNPLNKIGTKILYNIALIAEPKICFKP